MYVESKKAFYYTLEALLIFWIKLSNSIDKMGYQRNKYNWCVVNNIFKVRQCTILWHADNLKMLHVNSDVVSHVLADIDSEYGNILKMTIKHGKIHKYLGMAINYSFPGKVKFSMVDYIGNMFDNIPEDIKVNHQHRSHITSLILMKMQLNYPELTQNFYIVFWHSYYTYKSKRAHS